MMILQSCEIDYDNPPDASKSVVAVNGVPLGTQDNLFCITGGEGTGKSNYIAAILAGTLGAERLQPEQTLGLEVTANPKRLAVLHYDTEQSEAQLHKNLGRHFVGQESRLYQSSTILFIWLHFLVKID